VENLKRLLAKGLSNPQLLPGFLKRRVQFQITKVAPFNFKNVTGGLKEDAWIPHFSQRMYLEVKLLRYALGDLRAMNSLEIGAGYGRLTPWIAEFSAEHHAVEANPHFTEIAKVLYPGISFHTAK